MKTWEPILAMELRHYLDIVKRHRWLVIWATATVALVAGFTSAVQTPLYAATAKVLLQPTTENLYLDPSGRGPKLSDARFVRSQSEIAASPNVANAAAKNLGIDPIEVQESVSVSPSDTTDILSVTATDSSAEHAREIANAVAVAYKDNRRASAVEALTRAANGLQTQIDGLLRQIAELDARINDGGLEPGATASVTSPGAADPTSPTGFSQPPRSGVSSPGGTATTNEGLKAARHAAVVSYEALLNRQLQLKTDANLQQGEGEVFAPAEAPVAPVSPKAKRNAVLGGLVGLLIGLGLAFLREQLDDRLRSREELERVAGLPVLAELPVDDEVGQTLSLLVAEARPQSPLAEAVRSLRTSIQFLGVDEPVKRIVVTSPQPGDGKSLVAANLAVVFAQAGLKTVLISADLRRPGAEVFFDVPMPSTGLTDVLAGLPVAGDAAFDAEDAAVPRTAAATLARKRRAALTAALLPTKVPGLWLLPAGSPAPNPAELLASKRMSELLDDLGRQADVIVLDTPPVLAVTDAAVVAAKTDGVLLVTALGQTDKHAVERAIAHIDASQVLGTVMNRALHASYGYYGTDAKGSGKGLAGRRDSEPSHPKGPRWSERRALKREARADERSWRKARQQEQKAIRAEVRSRPAISASAGQDQDSAPSSGAQEVP